MVSVTLNKQRLLKELGMSDTDDLYQNIAMFGIEVESVTEKEITVDITPNRPDLLSQPGITRALSAFFNVKPGLRNYKTSKSKLKVRVDPSVRHIRPYTACAVVSGLKLDEEKLREIIEIQEKLHVTFARQRKRAAIGVYPMEAIKGNVTYTARKPEDIKFRPLEAEKEMTAKEILLKHPKGKLYAPLLKNLPMYPLFLDGKNNVLSMPPVINSYATGKITAKTTDVFIEASGHDFQICHEIVQMIAAALADLGGKIRTVDVAYGRKVERTPDMQPKRQEFYRYYVNRRLGIEITKEQLPKLLAKMGIGFEDGRVRETHFAIVPAYRVDFLHQIDVVEDIAIAHGYQNIKPSIPTVSTVASESRFTLFSDKIREILSGYGLLEAKSYHLLSSAFQRGIRDERLVMLKSSVSEEFDSLRTSVLSSLLHTLSENKLHDYPQQFFEIGTVFQQKQDVEEQKQLSITLAGEVDYTKVRQVVEGLLLSLGVQAAFVAHTDERFLKGRCARILIGDQHIGILGEISPRVLEHVQMTAPVAACELNIELLMRLTMT